jgi:hypothetical protein
VVVVVQRRGGSAWHPGTSGEFADCHLGPDHEGAEEVGDPGPGLGVRPQGGPVGEELEQQESAGCIEGAADEVGLGAGLLPRGGDHLIDRLEEVVESVLVCNQPGHGHDPRHVRPPHASIY